MKSIKVIVLLSIELLVSYHALAQVSFGYEVGAVHINQFSPVHEFDSIIVLQNGNEPFKTKIQGIFLEFRISKKIVVGQKINYSRAYNNYEYFNKNKEIWPGTGIVEKKVGGPSLTRISWETLPQFTFLEFGKIKLNAFGGINLSWNKIDDKREINFRGLPGVSKVGNAFRNAQIPISFNFAYGGSLEYSERLVFWIKWQPTSFYSKKIEIENQSYPFENRWNFFSFTLGYKFHSFKFKNTLKEAREPD